MAQNRAGTALQAIEGSAPLHDSTLLSTQGKTADLVWTKIEYERLARFLHNDNGHTQFVMAMRKAGRSHFFKSRKVTVERAISWSWRTITDEVAADKRTAFVPYSQNSEGLSRWGCLDFDAHDGDCARAQRHAFDAWQFLLNSDLTVIIEATGGGWHLWCIAKEFRSVRDWTLFLRGVAKAIEAKVKPGIYEVFPDDNGAKHGKGVRAPGSWNFPVALYSLAERLGLTPPGAGKLLRRFVESGIVNRTAYSVIHRSATRYAWRAGEIKP